MGTLAAASLFSGAGIGDLGFRAAGLDILAMCEIEPDRAALAALNFPTAHVEIADVWQASDRFVKVVCERLPAGEELFLLSCTAPCQGMSRSGQGTLLTACIVSAADFVEEDEVVLKPAPAVLAQVAEEWAW